MRLVRDCLKVPRTGFLLSILKINKFDVWRETVVCSEFALASWLSGLCLWRHLIQWSVCQTRHGVLGLFRCVPFSFLPEKHGMICSYVVFLELTHPSEVRTLVDVTVDPDGWAENAVTGKRPSQTLADAEGQALNRVSLIKADESSGSPSHENMHRYKTAYSSVTPRSELFF